MDPAPFPEELPERKVCVVGSELVENYTVYIIDVTDGKHRWTVKHRYSDFHDLHEKLAAEKKVDRRLLPPKKILGKNSRSLVERRQKELELYLQTLLLQFPEATPTALTCFLHLHLYEINGITAALAEELFHKGEQLLQAGQVFCLRPLQLYSVSQQLRLAKPTCCSGDARTDLGHILDFTCRLRYLKVCGSRGPVGTSDIQETSLPFDLSVFKSLQQIQISDCSSEQIEGLSTLRTSLETMNVHQSTQSMMAVLVPEAAEFPQWEPEGAEPVCPVTALVPVWRQLTTLDLSHNDISCIDTSVRLIPKVEFLDLSSNQLSSVENLQHLYNLVHVDLSHNNLQVLEAAHTRLGNIKTLNLAGNQLQNLSGLSKLYSLVNLDLSHNQLDQLEEIRNIGSLPCLEKLSLAGNPMCIIPDYRTKVLAQFGDRAAEVCLDSRTTTEKELDTVEVLKAIQKAKEVKDRMSSGDKKISEDTRPPAAPLLCSSSSSLSSSAPPASSSSSSSCPAQQASSPEVTSPEAAPPSILPPVDSTTPPANVNPPHLSAGPAQVQQSDVCLSELCGASTDVPDADITVCSSCSSSSTCSSCSASCWPLLPAHLLLLSASSQDFITQLSQRLGPAHRKEEEQEEEPGSGDLLQSAGDGTEPDGVSPGSRDGYFEMGLGDSQEEVLSSSSSVVQQQEEEEEVMKVSRVLWCCCVLVEPQQELQQREACLVLTHRLLALLFLSPDSTRTNQDAERDRSGSMEEVLSRLQVDLLVPYSQVQLSSPDRLPDSCLGFGLRSGPTRRYIFSEARQLRQTRTELTALVQAQTLEVQNLEVQTREVQNLEAQTREVQNLEVQTREVRSDPQLVPPSLLSSWELEESRGAQGGFAALLVAPPGPDGPPARPRVSPGGPPVLLFLTRRQLWVLEMDLGRLAEEEGGGSDPGPASWCRLVRIPLGSVVLHPSELRTRTCPDPQHLHRRRHSVELLLADQRLLLLFPLAQDRSSFLGELSQRRASLEGLRVAALPRPCRSCQEAHLSAGRDRCCSSSRKSNSCSSWNSSRLQVEENHPSPHLLPGLSPGLKLLAGLGGQQLLAYFHRFIALSESEDLKQVLWLSVVLYKSPEAELTCCLLLSTDHIYFLLEDSASTLTHHSVLEVSDAGDPDCVLVCCLSISLSELLAVNVGLFDQYFRVVGGSADHIVCCLSRDTYGTGVFLQELMAALSLQQQLPPPEPSDQDFYSQFTHTCSGKMQNYELVHSSQVKFIYPSEEEMGDLTFIVAERKSPASCSRSFNVLLYLLVFQVQVPSSPGSGPSAVLQPRTLILTSTDVFLLDEDYVSYPLPDFAKEPPSRERYQLREARRIRDLDRVLLGYQTYPQALTLVFDDLPGPDLLCHLTMDHFAGEEAPPRGGGACGGAEGEVQWCVFVPGADSRERLISLLARQWEALCSRELPVELTG